MHYSSSFLALAVLASFTLATPVEVDLVRRDNGGDGSSADKAIVRPIQEKDKRAGEDEQQLLDFDCYTHLCQYAPVVLQRWSENDYNRGPNGNDVSSTNLFSDDKKRKQYLPSAQYNSFPGGKDSKFRSPEEWPPASTVQGGVTSFVGPATIDSQKDQASSLSSFYSKKIDKISIEQMKPKNKPSGWKPSSRGYDPKASANAGDAMHTWFRISQFEGADGPHCKVLNGLLDKFSDNFNTQTGVIKNKPSICTEDATDKRWGFDVGKFCFAWNDKTSQYKYVGK